MKLECRIGLNPMTMPFLSLYSPRTDCSSFPVRAFSLPQLNLKPELTPPSMLWTFGNVHTSDLWFATRSGSSVICSCVPDSELRFPVTA